MVAETKRNVWQAPWGYPESFVLVAGVVAVGLLLEMSIGSFDFYLLARPINYVAALVILLLGLWMGLRSRKSALARYVVSTPWSVALISALLLLSILMGFTPQQHHSTTLLGFDSMTSNWAFVLIYALTLLSLGAIITRRIRRFRLSDTPFHLNHLGLLLTLLCAGLGYADMQRYVMYVSEGETQWRVYDSNKQIRELPIAITLHDFGVEYYPSKAIFFDVESGEVQRGEPKRYEGDERYVKIMAEPEPKRFSSQVSVFTKQGDVLEGTIEVNKPLRVGSWSIYQYGYDNQAGNLSTYSSFELVYDPWLGGVYLGIILMMVGSVAMILTGKRAEKEQL